jgi:hypothetical protein
MQPVDGGNPESSPIRILQGSKYLLRFLHIRSIAWSVAHPTGRASCKLSSRRLSVLFWYG